MSDVLKRTVFYEKRDGYIRFQDWALVVTKLGTMAEPFNVNARYDRTAGDIASFDYTDNASRIDEMIEIDADKSMLLLSGGNHQLHGGNLLVRTGR